MADGRESGRLALVVAVLVVLVASVGAIGANGSAGDTDDHRPRARDRASGRPATPRVGPPHRPTKHVAPTVLVSRIVDGDTLELGDGRTVRLVGIDTPERGECGYEQASQHLADLVLGRRVVLRTSDEDTDRYGRLLRYVDVPAARSGRGRVVDAGLDQIRSGLAIARYDSRDGYGFHPREPAYVRADAATPGRSCPAPPRQPAAGPRSLAQRPGAAGRCRAGYRPCLPVVADLDCGEIGRPVVVTGSDPYRLDGDGDGTGCD